MPIFHAAAERSLAEQRKTFVAADQALKRGDSRLFRQHTSTLSSYPLYAYLLYRDLRQRIEDNPIIEMRAFLAAYDGSPVAARLRTAWLRQLAKQQRWKDFLTDYRPGRDTEIACYRRQGLIHSGRTNEALDGIAELWLVGRSLPAACDPLFQIWKSQGGFTPQRVWRRFTLAMAAGQRGLARYLSKELPPPDQLIADLWLQVDENPRLVLESKRFDADHSRTGEVLLHGIRRWSREDSLSAAEALDRLKKRYRLPAEPLAKLERQLALFVASRGAPGAIARLTALPPSMVDQQVQEWRVRTGLQRGDWHATLAWLDAMEPALMASLPWQYWRARALEGLGRTQAADEIYRRLSGERDYHGFLAADRLALPYQLGDTPIEISATARNALLMRTPALRRAGELHHLGRSWEARSEWHHGIRSLDTKDLEAAAAIAHRWNWHPVAITTLARAQHWDDLEMRFPMPYQGLIRRSTESKAIDPAWAYAIMRQESIFQWDAKSSAGALGLMQLMPATGRRIARELKITLSGDYALLNADTNIALGTQYLRHTLDKLQQNPLLATAAYNAGPRRVAQWLPEHNATEADLWVETIPFKETRNYVKRVMEYATIYTQRLEGGVTPISARMMPVKATQPGR